MEKVLKPLKMVLSHLLDKNLKVQLFLILSRQRHNLFNLILADLRLVMTAPESLIIPKL